MRRAIRTCGTPAEANQRAMEESVTNVRVLGNVLIPMRDGMHLAARVLLPEADGPVPAVVTLMPYHKDGAYSMGYLDSASRAFAASGYAVVVADLRGIGNSEGRSPYAFAADERLDGYDLVEWTAAQTWCTGNVGMWGVSYGGITALSTAAARPPSLRAIVPIHAATDMYWDYLVSHGCRVAFSPDVHWGVRMAANNLLPPIHDAEGSRWDDLWRERMHHYRPWILDWHERAHHDETWRRATTDPRHIEAATYVVGGWRDIFADVSFRVFDQLSAPKRLLVGPWKHIFPDLAGTSPIGFVQEMQRWWERWLKGVENDVDQEPPIAYYVYGADEWRHARQWPPSHGRPVSLVMTSSRSLVAEAEATDGEGALIDYTYHPLVGLDTIAMHWLPGPDTPSYPPSDDAVSICFDGAPLDEPVEIIGTPVVRLNLGATVDELPLVARLFAIDAKGGQHLITLGWAKGRAADPAADGEGVPPGEAISFALPLRPIAYRVPAGSSLRLTVSCADLSRLWPEPRHFDLALHQSRLEFPALSGRDDDLPVPRFQPPEMAPSPGVTTRVSQIRVRRDLIAPVVSLEAESGQTFQLAEGAKLDTDLEGVLTVDGERPWRTTLRARATYVLRRPSGTVRTEATMLETVGHLHVGVVASVDDIQVYARDWTVRIGGAGEGGLCGM